DLRNASSLNRQVMDVDYYIAMGGAAYAQLHDAVNLSVFAELASGFATFVDILGEISENSALSSNTDFLRDYEVWLRTGSPRLIKKLKRNGILPARNNLSTRHH
ncbi:MAG: hypothetical protein AAF387_15075, partial [Pseudomonadota bacterium]